MINKKLLSFAPGALRYVGVNVAFQWMGLLWNVIFVRAVARLVGAVFAGTLTSRLLWQNLALCLCSIPFRFVFTMLSSRMSHEASKDVKGTLRSRIYQKLVALGENYTETVATSEVVMLASEGVARAFLHDAPFLLLDEPTSNLDSLNEGIILRAVRSECQNKTVLLVSHRRSTMAAADLSFSVENGRLS